MLIAILRAAVPSICFGVLTALAPAHAQLNQFEIREPKVEAGEVEVEYLADYHFLQPRRRFIEAPPGSGTLVFDDNDFNRQRHTLGMAYGLTRWLSLQVAVEAEQARFEDVETLARANAFGELKVTEIELEGTIVLIPTGKRGFGVAALIEHNIALERGEAHQLFLGTALQYVQGPWSATANLYLVKNIGGREERDGMSIKDERLDFQYAAQIKYVMNDNFALALRAMVSSNGSQAAVPRARRESCWATSTGTCGGLSSTTAGAPMTGPQRNRAKAGGFATPMPTTTRMAPSTSSAPAFCSGSTTTRRPLS